MEKSGFVVLLTVILSWLEVCNVSAQVVAYWPFGKNGFADVSGNGNDLTVGASGVTLGTNGQVVLDGTLSRFMSSRAVDLSSYSAYTVECWMRMPAANTAVQIFLELSPNSGNNVGTFYLDVNESASGSLLGSYKPSNGYNQDATAKDFMFDGKWHHVAQVVDKSIAGADCSVLYVDGVKQGVNGSYTGSGTGTFPSSQILYIGSRANSSYKFVGELDDVRITGRALTPGEFISTRSAGKILPVAYWPFGAHGGMDISGNGHVFEGTGVSYRDGAAVFDGTQGVLATRLPVDLRGCTEGMTLEMWVKTDSQKLMMLLEQTEEPGSTPFAEPGAFYLDIGEAASKGVRGMFRCKSGYSYNMHDATNAISDNAWHHIALLYRPFLVNDPERGQVYVDGILQPTNTYYSSSSWTSLRNGYFYLGAEANGTYPFIGEIDDLRVTPAVLTPDEFMKERSLEDGEVAAYWPFTAGLDSRPLADATGNGHTLALQSGSVAYDGEQALASAPAALTAAGTLALSSASNLTVECFVRAEPHAATNGCLLRLGNGTDAGAFTLRVDKGALTGFFGMGGGLSNAEASAGDVLADGAWHSVALVYDASAGTADRVRLYVDGTRQPHAGEVAGTQLASFAIGTVTLFDAAGDMAVALDDVRVTTAALAPAQFQLARTENLETDGKVVAYWKFSPGKELEDETGAFPLFMETRKDVLLKDGSATFRGRNGLFTAAPMDLSIYDKLTVEAMVRFTATNAGMNFVELGSNYNTTVGAFDLSSAMLENDHPGAGFRTSDGYNVVEAGKGTLSDGQWHHLAYVMDRTAGGSVWASFYVDGVKAGTVASGFDKTNDVPFVRDALYLGFRYGANFDSLDTANHYLGDMDEVRITAAALAPEDFLKKENRSEIPATNSVMAFWTFNDGTAKDQSGHGYDLAASGDVTFTSHTAKFGTSHGLLKTSQTLPLSTCTAYTVECFFKTVKTSNEMFLHTGTYSGGGEFYLGLETFVGNVLSCANLGNGRFHMDELNGTAGATPANDGVWHHAAVIWDIKENGVDFGRLYVDGVQMRQSEFSAFGLVSFRDVVMAIGNYTQGAGYEFEGEIDDVRVTARALSPDEFLVRPTVIQPEVIAYWPFHARSPLADVSGNGYTLTNDSSSVQFPASSCTAVFDGKKNLLRTANKLNLSAYDALTIEFFGRTVSTNLMIWAELTGWAENNLGSFYLLSECRDVKGEDVQTLFMAERYLVYTKGKAGMRSWYNQDFAFTDAVKDGKWHHWALVIDRTVTDGDQAVLYFDGVKYSTRSVPNYGVFFPNDYFYLGARSGGLYPLIGEMDDVRISGAALTPDQFLKQRSKAKGFVIMLK